MFLFCWFSLLLSSLFTTIEGVGDYPIPLAHDHYRLSAIFATSQSVFPGLHTHNSLRHMVPHFLSRKLLLTVIVGDIMSFRIFGQVIVVLNSIQVAKDVLEKKGDIYSDRSVPPFYEM
jgi:hypothetical protein